MMNPRSPSALASEAPDDRTHEPGAPAALRVVSPDLLRRLRSPVERFALSFCELTVNVDSMHRGTRAVITRYLSPLVLVGEPVPDPVLTVELRCGGRADVDAYTVSAMSRTPYLQFAETGARLTILAREDGATVALRAGEADTDELLVIARPSDRRFVLAFDHLTAGAERALARQMKFVLGSLARKRGAVVVHAAAVDDDGSALLIVGDRGAGKSSLSFLATTLLGWRFVSDDLIFARPAGAGLAVTGWPNRVTIGANLLHRHPSAERIASSALRRYPQGLAKLPAAGSWAPDQRRRIYVDLDELFDLVDVVGTHRSSAVGVVFPCAVQDLRGWDVRPASRDGSWVQPNRANLRQLRYAEDFLSLLPDAPFRDDSNATIEAMDALPAVEVRYGPDVNDDFAAFWADVVGALDR